MGRVVVVGLVRRVIVTDVDRLPGPGDVVEGQATHHGISGSGVEQALAVRRAGGRVVLVGAVGRDDAGRACGEALGVLGVPARLQRGSRHPTSMEITARDPEGGTMTVVGPGARLRTVDGPVLHDVGTEDVVLVPQGLPGAVLRWLASLAQRRGARFVVNASPYAELPSEVLSAADPFVVGERDAALLADVGLIPGSLCVTFGRAGAVWDGLRVDSDDLGAPAMAPGGTEAFCAGLAAALAAGADLASALRAAVTAAGEPPASGAQRGR